MKGLLLKDLYVLKDSLKVYLIIFLLYGYMGIVEGEIGLMYAMVFITSVVLPITSVSYDERCGWDRLANTMPVSRKQIVYSKYLLAKYAPFWLFSSTVRCYKAMKRLREGG